MKHNLWFSPEKTRCIYLFESGKCFLTGHTNFYLMLWIFASQKNLTEGIDFSWHQHHITYDDCCRPLKLLFSLQTCLMCYSKKTEIAFSKQITQYVLTVKCTWSLCLGPWCPMQCWWDRDMYTGESIERERKGKCEQTTSISFMLLIHIFNKNLFFPWSDFI